MEELRKLRRVLEREGGQVREVLLVLDATTGQNGLAQARQFTDAVGVTGVVLTKLDGTAKGGIVIAVQRDLGIPVKLVGLGEGAHDRPPSTPTPSSTPAVRGRRLSRAAPAERSAQEPDRDRPGLGGLRQGCAGHVAVGEGVLGARPGVHLDLGPAARRASTNPR
jgi:hypothetical protein